MVISEFSTTYANILSSLGLSVTTITNKTKIDNVSLTEKVFNSEKTWPTSAFLITAQIIRSSKHTQVGLVISKTLPEERYQHEQRGKVSKHATIIS